MIAMIATSCAPDEPDHPCDPESALYNGCKKVEIGGECTIDPECEGDNVKCIDDVCVCFPLCGGKECGDDGCEASCGECMDNGICQAGKCLDRIYSIQSSLISQTCNDEAFVDGGSVSLGGLSVASPRYVVSKDKLHGFFATTPGGEGPFSGVLVVTEWSDDVNLEVGTGFDIEADWTEYYCLTQLSATKITETGENRADELMATDITASDMGEAYEGVVVILTGPFEVEEAVNQYGEITLSEGVVIRLKFDGVEWDPQVGTTVLEVTGPVDYRFGKYMIMPRSDADVQKE